MLSGRITICQRSVWERCICLLRKENMQTNQLIFRLKPHAANFLCRGGVFAFFEKRICKQINYLGSSRTRPIFCAGAVVFAFLQREYANKSIISAQAVRGQFSVRGRCLCLLENKQYKRKFNVPSQVVSDQRIARFRFSDPSIY